MAVSAPPTAASQLDGLLVVAAGTKLEVHSWNGKQLVRNAFFDAPMCLTSLNVLKNYILVGDVHKGLTFVMYKVCWVCGECMQWVLSGGCGVYVCGVVWAT